MKKLVNADYFHSDSTEKRAGRRKFRFISLLVAAAIALPQAVSFAAGDGEIVCDYAETAAVATAEPSETPAATEEPEEEEEEEYEEPLFNPSVEYEAYETVAEAIAERYVDPSYTTEDIMRLGISKYLEENGEDALVALLKAATHGLDDYSDFYTREEYLEYTNEINKTFYGLGIQMQQNGEYVEIAGFVEENGLAQQSGFEVGDKIIKVDGKDVVGYSTSEVRTLITGEINTTVQITVLRDGNEIEITGTRTAVNTSTVSGGIFEGNIGYIKIASFNGNTPTEFKEIADNFTENGVSKLILDLRGNPGGVVSAATSIAAQLIPKGKIIDVSYRNESMNRTYESELETVPFDMIVLVNGNTASAAEILASSIQDSKAGVLLGEQTYGKAVIQSTFPLTNGKVFKITVGQYITRNGNEINHVGLTPDYEVENYTKKIDTTTYTKFDFLTPTSIGASGQNVTAAKERLQLMGYFSGNMKNDVFNTDLREAIKVFQKDNDLTDSGVLDVETQIKMKTVFETLETVVDVQLQEAYTKFGGNADDLYN